MTDPVIPFSALMLLELLFGELGPDPGALLHAESKTHPKTTIRKHHKVFLQGNLDR